MSTLADDILAAMDDVNGLLAWATPNSIAVEDEQVDEAIQRALLRPVPDELRGESLNDLRASAPLLRFASGRTAVVGLLDGLTDRPRNPSCGDRCGAAAQHRTYRLLVPAGQSAVAVFCCFYCRDLLNDLFSDLVWD